MMEEYCEEYKRFLNSAKTVTETVREILRLAYKNGFETFQRREKFPEKTVGEENDYIPGKKMVQVIRGKALVLSVIGKRPLSDGCKMIAAHIDSPCLDLKPVPLESEAGKYYLKTHYYGKIKKYHWVCTPLSLHGIVVNKKGGARSIVIGENLEEPILGITDLLPHLSEKQMQKSMENGITGEQLKIIAGEAEESLPEKVWDSWETIRDIAYDELMTAEIKAVPAFHARDVGLDRSMIGAYGQDDRVGVFAAIKALVSQKNIPEYTSFVFLADKEEVGSDSSAGLCSEAFLDMVMDIGKQQGVGKYQIMAKAECLSVDAVCGYDPLFPDVVDEKNTAKLGEGLAMVRYTGRMGKKGNSEASACFMAKIAGIFDNGGVRWQCGEMGAVDAGGGTTVARCMASWGAEVIDVGVGMFSMHSPMEITAKKDVWNLYLGLRAFLQDDQKHICDEIIYETI